MPTLVKNKKASFDYEILTEYEAGIELLGSEVKSLRAGRGKLEGCRVIIRGGEVFIVGMAIEPYQPANTPSDYDPQRTRKLLLTKKEIEKLTGKEQESGLTIIPLSVYTKGKKLKIEIAVARGKKKRDKRQVIKKREDDRRIEREMKRSF